MALLTYLEDSALSQWLGISMLGFPTLIALHSVGMAVAVGLSLIVTLRLYRVVPGLDNWLIPRLLNLALWGFVLNLITGLALFITRGTEYISSAIFLIKMLLVLIGAMIMFRIWLQLERSGPNAVTAEVDSVRVMSLVSTVSFIGAVIAGRLIAYLSDLY